MTRSRLTSWTLAVWLLSSIATARAQAPSAEAEPTDGALQPPVLLEAPPAHYPPGSDSQPATEVAVRVTIDTEGRVSEASVTESASPELDAAARDAALRYRFAPAKRGNVPITSRVNVRIAFTPPPSELKGHAIPGTAPAADSGDRSSTVPPATHNTGPGGAPSAPRQRMAGSDERSSPGADSSTAPAQSEEGSAAVTPPAGSEAGPSTQIEPRGEEGSAGVAPLAGGEAGPSAQIEPSAADGGAATSGESPGLIPRASNNGNQPAQVIVHGRQSEAQRLAQSAEAVTVQTLTTARRESAPLAEVLARIPGVSMRRSGGLGSGERLSLNGLSDEQVATFIDTIPLDFSYLTADLGSFPVNLADRVEVYKGVVPVRFGLDALGGAVNIVTDQRMENRLGASAEVGSFGTQRISVGGSYRHEPTGFVASLLGYFDNAKNDYEIEVDVPDAEGRTQRRTVPRFHDGYRAYGVSAELGVVDKPWARRLLVQGYAGGSSQDIQHNLIMTVPYGEMRAGQRVLGSTARYELDVLPRLKLQAVAAYSYRVFSFVDRSEWVYDWFGKRGRRQAVLGESGQRPFDTLSYRHSGLGRVSLQYNLAPGQLITLTSSPMYSSQDGESRIEQNLREADEITNLNQRLTVVTGLEHESNWLELPNARPVDSEANYRLQNRLFVKHYNYQLWTEQAIVGGQGKTRERSKHDNRVGIGDGVRFRFTRWLMLKLSYEYAVRLPRAHEIFGDGGQRRANLELNPELSHNINVTPVLDLVRTAIGDLHYEVTGFLRDTKNQIVLLSSDRVFKYENVNDSSSLGFETALRWTSPGRYLTLDGSMTLQDFRNRSTEGEFAAFNGDRLPNKPWLFASWGARLRFQYQTRHRFEPFYIARAVGSFFRGWETRGDLEYKARVPAQLAHGLGLSYMFSSQVIDYSVTFEVQNFTDAKLYDFFGVQRPGRSYWLKLTGQLH